MKAVATVAIDSRKLWPLFEYTSPAALGASRFGRSCRSCLRLDRSFFFSPMAEEPELLSDETQGPRSLFSKERFMNFRTSF